jgi:hypothetical protein
MGYVVRDRHDQAEKPDRHAINEPKTNRSTSAIEPV